ncbi:UDP-glucose 4-epimerase [Pirellula sp. SH-Sr6A]|uniref:SDR family oxidoreductase n=1 Tax=Pirellula sp. SH-Sr6A TaxID=1632865 RepID=UPI00078CBCD6|nr:SDR family oxidoreductase [Pirellula sp. SH-Sr6A]AMV31097.1 UDP-glucose 4-epimerase [Pirellula sp. SH-Sr6A]
MAKCLVTGGAGFIGSHIVYGLVDAGHSVRVLDNLGTGSLKNLEAVSDRIEFVKGSVTDPIAVQEALSGVERVFHQAALASVPLSLEKPLETHDACATGTLNMLHWSVKAKVKRFVYAASSSAYGDQPTSSKRETDLPMPLSPYAVAKLTGEYYCQAYYHSFGLETVGIRYFNVYGPRQDPNSPYSAVIPLFVSRILQGQPALIYGDGLQSRDFTYVANVVHGNLLAAERPNIGGRIINVADGRQTTLLQLLEFLGEMLRCRPKIEFLPPRMGDVRESLADITLARRLLGYEPQIGLEEGLKRTIDYYRQTAR